MIEPNFKNGRPYSFREDLVSLAPLVLAPSVFDSRCFVVLCGGRKSNGANEGGADSGLVAIILTKNMIAKRRTPNEARFSVQWIPRLLKSKTINVKVQY